MKRILLFLSFVMMMATVMAQVKPTTYCFVEGDEPLYLDHYRAEGEGKHPCLLFAFGGGFSHGNRADQRYMKFFDVMLKQGFDVVSIDYRLGMKFTVDAPQKIGPLKGAKLMYRSVNYAAEDVMRATRYILDNADKMGINPDCIVTSGSSAGAIAVLQAENHISNHSRYAKILPKEFNYAGVIACAGAIYSVLSKPKWHKMPCPVMLFHGNADRNVPYYKATICAIGFYGSDFIADQLHKKGATYYFHSAHYRDHSLALLPLFYNHEEIISFLRRCVLGGEKMQYTNEYVDKDIEPCETNFSVQEYLNSNYDKK